MFEMLLEKFLDGHSVYENEADLIWHYHQERDVVYCHGEEVGQHTLASALKRITINKHLCCLKDRMKPDSMALDYMRNLDNGLFDYGEMKMSYESTVADLKKRVEKLEMLLCGIPLMLGKKDE